MNYYIFASVIITHNRDIFMYDFEKLSTQYELDINFLQQLYERIVDKDKFLKAVDMFKRGLLPLDVATTQDDLNIGDYRKEVAQNLLKIREKIKEEQRKAQELEKNIYDYLGKNCKCFRLLDEKKKNVRFAVFVHSKEETIVCFMAFNKAGKGGIHMANIPELLENYNWQPNDALRDLRQISKSFVKSIKKSAKKAPFAWFNFAPRNIRTR